MKPGSRLKEARKNKKLSQLAVAEHLNITRQSVSKWENDITYPDKDNIAKLCKLFDISSDYILYGEVLTEEIKEVAVEDQQIENEELSSKISEAVEEEETVKNSIQKSVNLEKEGIYLGIILTLINVVFWFMSPLGLIVGPITIIKSKTTTRLFKIIIIVVSIISIFISLFSLYGHLSAVFHFGGTTSVEYMGP